MTWFLVVLTGLIGLALALGGAWLIALGGSTYYVLAGIGLLLTAHLIRRRSSMAYGVYAVVLLGSLVWALTEVGFDWWALAPRGGLLVVIGLLMALHWWSRADRRTAGAAAWRWQTSGAALVASLVIAAGTGGFAMTRDLHRIDGVVPPVAGPVTLPPSEASVPDGEWLAYGRTRGGSHYSPLADLKPTNVAQLTKAWEYRTGEVRNANAPEETTYEVTPTVVDGLMYLCTPHHVAIALDPVTGQEKWKYDAKVGQSTLRQHQTCRGLTTYRVDGAAPADPCSMRVLLPTSNAQLIALDAKTGQRCAGFGQDGMIDLWAGMPNRKEGSYYSTSPPAVARNLIIVGGAVNDNVSTHEASGVIRAYDAKTGALVWNFDAGNPDKTEPIGANEQYVANSPNAWSILSVDADLGMVYAPMGNAPPDQFGGKRTPETERFSSSVLALDLASGRLQWVFQMVHHDLWDMDTPSEPQLVDVNTASGVVPALVQATKQGDIYVLDRRNGTAIVPVTNEPAPMDAAAGDHSAPQQPTSAMSFKPQPLAEKDMWGATPLDQLYCRIAFHNLAYEGRYTAPSTKGSIVYPGNFGTFNWGGVAIDPMRQVVIANPVYLAFTVKLIPRADDTTNYVSKQAPGFNENYGAPFAAMMQPFRSPLGLPCQQPPWGYVAAADLATGRILWQHRNGTTQDLSPIPIPFEMGVPGIGGPIVTAGGVAFHSGTLDDYVRAFDVTDGRELWRSRLPAGGQATPATYRGADGRQYLVVVAGGHGSTGTKPGDSIIAYALPK